MELDNSQNIKQSIDFFNGKSFEVYRDWIDTSMKLNKFSTIFLFLHLKNFIKKNFSQLGYQKFFYLEKLFHYSLELRLLDVAKKILKIFNSEFSNEPKIIKMQTMLTETESTDNISSAITLYKKLIHHNQEDRASIKKYIGLIKQVIISDENGKYMGKYIDIWNEYLKIYMDDFEAWYELSDIYIFTNNFNKAIFCLEEVLLHQPNNYAIYTKIGDIFSSFNNSESANSAVKYYSQSILLKSTPRAFWGLVYALNIISRANKGLDQKSKNLFKIAVVNLQNLYANSPFKFAIDQFYDLQTE